MLGDCKRKLLLKTSMCVIATLSQCDLQKKTVAKKTVCDCDCEKNSCKKIGEVQLRCGCNRRCAAIAKKQLQKKVKVRLQ
jgi:hypothetical protein